METAILRIAISVFGALATWAAMGTRGWGAAVLMAGVNASGLVIFVAIGVAWCIVPNLLRKFDRSSVTALVVSAGLLIPAGFLFLVVAMQ